jgi:hypothetical protein
MLLQGRVTRNLLLVLRVPHPSRPKGEDTGASRKREGWVRFVAQVVLQWFIGGRPEALRFALRKL